MEIQWRGGKILLRGWAAGGDAHLIKHLGRVVSVRRPSFGRLRTGLGSTSLATNAYGWATSRLSYKPFGGTAWFTAVLPTDYGFTGQRYEATTGYIYDFNARYYDEYIGRFISADSIVPGAGNPQALNRYAYTLNNPLKYIDASGHKADEPTDTTPPKPDEAPSAPPEEPPRTAPCPATGCPDLTDILFMANPIGVAAAVIKIPADALVHVIERHVATNIAKYAGKSKFLPAIDIIDLIKAAESVAPIKQARGNLARIIDAGVIIGEDKLSGLGKTSIYTVITDVRDTLITMFPGLPR